MTDFESFLARAERLLDRLEHFLPSEIETDWDGIAFRWARGRGLARVPHPHGIRLENLKGIASQVDLAEANTRQFVNGHSANNVLLTGARGTGKSSLVKALLNRYAADGLRLIEVEKKDLTDLPQIVEKIEGRREKFILFCDDLTFDQEEGGYRELKVVLDGSVSTAPDNVLVYATSNRRHLMPEFMSENLETKYLGDEIHPGETVEEKISLSERFGLWISFHPFEQEGYLEIVHHWLDHFGVKKKRGAEKAALQWALNRGSRSGRIAWQFARDWAGKEKG
ncbi:MAG: ATP-binding protein [Burkholderiales bacterium]|nr:ATP-binding protein [Burkholderiales bacterium]